MDEISNKPKRAFGRSLKDFENLSDAEKKLIDCAARGEVCVLGKAAPEAPAPENLVRPELIRFLALGGDDDAPVHEKGVRLQGAWIGVEKSEDSRALDFEGARLVSNLWLDESSFQHPPNFREAQGKVLSLEGSTFPGLLADGLKLNGSLNLQRTNSKAKVSLNSAEINGALSCKGGRFESEDGVSFFCDRAKIGGGVFLSENFIAIGRVRLNGAEIGGQLACNGGNFINNNGVAISCDGARIGDCVFCNENFTAVGEVRLTGSVINGDLNCWDGFFDNRAGYAFRCERAKIGGALFLNLDSKAVGMISLAHTSITTLADNIEYWPNGSLNLDGFRYERVDACSSLDAKSRIAWLDKQHPMFLAGDSFALQPWIHLAKVLREQGHFREAAEVDIAREERLRAAGKIGDRRALLSWAGKWGQLTDQGNLVSFFSILSSVNDFIGYYLHWFYGLISGYGHRPMRIFYSAALLWLFCALVFHLSADTASFTLSNPAAARILRDDCENKFASENLDLMRCAERLKTYPRFSPWAYSFDLILPVVRLGQSTTWAPTWDAVWTQRLVWFEEIFGWIAALTLAAIAAGLVKRKDG